ncbi:MAG: hypothetical protein PCFJNLEI_02527 [Verrucomicrobiae bacterium]|nr:hypothetical protein [Verrucomicrobiae bacterium]
MTAASFLLSSYPGAGQDAGVKTRPWLPYVLPMAIYMGFLLIQTPGNLLWIYPLKTVAVAAALWWFRREYSELVPRLSWLAVTVGLVAIAIWIFGDPYYPKIGELLFATEMKLSQWLNWPPPVADTTPPFDPTGRYWFIVFRIIGAVVVVPLMEELFWRAFLIRWLVSEDFRSVPVGTYTWTSFAFTTVLFGLEHDQWLAGLFCGALYNWLLYRTRSVWACVIAHAVSNAALAGWVLARGDWKFW